jgi:hypothetical protein
MLDKITKTDVFLYFANKLDRARRRELESACRSDEQVRRWFDELTPTEEEIERMPLPAVRLDSPEVRRLAVIAYLSVERDEYAEDVILDFTRRVRDRGESGGESRPTPDEIAPLQLFQGSHGSLLARKPVPRTLAGGNPTVSVAPTDVPWIEPDYDNGRLLIRQQLDPDSDGKVRVLIVRTRKDSGVETVFENTLQLRYIEPRDGAPYWSEDVDLKSLIGDFHPDDDFIYCVEAVPGT